MMISYEVYKIIHVFMVILMIATFAVNFSSQIKKKWASIFSGIATLFIFVSGMGLMARLGVAHGEPWPKWIVIKMTVWLIVAIISPIILKRLPKVKPYGFPIIMSFALVAIVAAVLKP